jgi:hypothetical protein
VGYQPGFVKRGERDTIVNDVIFHREAIEGRSFEHAVGPDEDHVTIAKSGGIDVTKEREDDADTVAFGWSEDVFGDQGRAWRGGGLEFIGQNDGGGAKPPKNKGKVGRYGSGHHCGSDSKKEDA